MNGHTPTGRPWRARPRRQRLGCLVSALGIGAALAGSTHAEPLILAGRGPKRTDCLSAWVVDVDGPPSDVDRRKARVTCRDGSPSCDADGEQDGQCTIRLQVCFGVTLERSTCTPQPLGLYDLARPSPRAARRNPTAAANRTAILEAVASLGQPIAPGACTGDVLLHLPVKRKGSRRKVIVRASVHTATGRQRDKDVLRLKCKAARNTQTSRESAVVLTTDFMNLGTYATVTLDPPRRVRRNLGTTHADAIGRAFQGRVYVVNRLGQDNIQIVNPESGKSLAACSIGNGTNPQDIAFVDSDKAYVTRLRDGLISIVDPTVPPTCGGFLRGRINLRRFADADGSPELGSAVIVGDYLYVAVGRLDRARGFVPAARGLVAVIDTRTDSLVDVDPSTPEIDAIGLAGDNPFGMIHDPTSGKIWVWQTGSFFQDNDGGIEAIDPATNRAEGFFATEQDLGGTVTVAAPYSAARAFAVVAAPDFRNTLIAFSPLTGQRLQTLHTSSHSLSDVAVHQRGEVWLADRTLREPGIRIFDAASGNLLVGPIDVGQPPFDIVFVQ